MGHVDKIERPHFVRDPPHAGKINDSGISATPTDDQLRAFLIGKLFQVIVINGLSFLCYSVRNDAISFTREIQVMAVGEMSTVRQVEPEDGVARLQHRGIRFHVGLRSSVRLYVCVIGAE